MSPFHIQRRTYRRAANGSLRVSLSGLVALGLLIGVVGCVTHEFAERDRQADKMLEELRGERPDAADSGDLETVSARPDGAHAEKASGVAGADELLRSLRDARDPGTARGDDVSGSGTRDDSSAAFREVGEIDAIDPGDPGGADADSEVPSILSADRAAEEPGTSRQTTGTAGDPADIDDAARQLRSLLGESEGGDATKSATESAGTGNADEAVSARTEPAVAPPTGAESPEPSTTPQAPPSAEANVARVDPVPPTLRSGGAQEETPQEQPQKPPRPEGKVEFFTFFHKTYGDFHAFLREDFPDFLNKGHVAEVKGKPREVMFFGADETIDTLVKLAKQFDDMALKVEKVPIKPKYIDVKTLMDSLTLAGVANVWTRVKSTVQTQANDGKKYKTIETFQEEVYSQGGIAGGESAPLPFAPRVPYVFQMPSNEPFEMPRYSTGKGDQDQMTIQFENMASTEERGVMMAVGTAEDIERIRAFVDSVDRPARRIMIEVQLIELDANQLSDIGLDAIQFGQRHTLGSYTTPFPGESIVQPGAPDVFRRPGVEVPDVVQEGVGIIFDDTTEDISGRFIANLHLLVRRGDAKVKARPKILTLDDRSSILHIGDEVPTFESTRIDRDVTGGNFVETINQVTTQYVGFTLNIRPRVTGEDEDEVALLLEVVSNQLRGRERVFQEDLLGIPVVSRRKFTGQTRVKNHRPVILGGLIQEEESESTATVPFLGDIPVLGRLFSRVQKEKRRTEVILVVTPHILSEKGWDPAASPKESIHFDTFDSVLFNDRYILKGKDVWGIDPITKQPAMMDGEIFTEEEIVDLTLLNIVKQRELVSKLGIFEEYIPDEAEKLGWLQRAYPERSVAHWEPEEQVVYYKAAAIVIENIKSLNPGLKYEEIVLPRREIVLPTTPYRMSLTFDKYKTYVDKGQPVLRDGGDILTENTVELLREVGQSRTVRQFAEFIRQNEIDAERHGELRWELQRLYAVNYPRSNAAETDSYSELYDVLAEGRLDFLAIATFFQQELGDRYLTRGAPRIGAFEADLESFLKTSITISERAKRLRELDTRWSILAEEEEASP